MTCPPLDDVRISRVHNEALCKAIAERLGAGLDQAIVPMPPRLMRLMTQLLHEQDDMST
jgi:hypothetical protein